MFLNGSYISILENRSGRITEKPRCWSALTLSVKNPMKKGWAADWGYVMVARTSGPVVQREMEIIKMLRTSLAPSSVELDRVITSHLKLSPVMILKNSARKWRLHLCVFDEAAVQNGLYETLERPWQKSRPL